MAILDILSSGNYITYNKVIARKLGIDEAILLGELCSKQALYRDEFFIQMDRLIEDTCLTEYRIRNAMKALQNAGILSVTKKGLPAKNFYLLNVEALGELLGLQRTSDTNIQSTSCIKFDTTGDTKFDSTKENTSKENITEHNKERDTKASTEPSYQLWHEAYNELCTNLPQCRNLTDKRKASIRSAIKQGVTLEDFQHACRKANASSFMTGNNARGWKATPDFLFNVNNIIKILEGNYDDKQNSDTSWCKEYADNPDDVIYVDIDDMDKSDTPF